MWGMVSWLTAPQMLEVKRGLVGLGAFATKDIKPGEYLGGNLGAH